MPDPIPAEAVQAAARWLLRQYESTFSGGCPPLAEFESDAQDLVEAIAPALAVQVRRKVAAEFRARAARIRAIPDKGLTLGQRGDRERKAADADRAADMIEKGAADAGPSLAEQVRGEAAEQVAAAIEEDDSNSDIGDRARAWAARLARQIGEADDLR